MRRGVKTLLIVAAALAVPLPSAAGAADPDAPRMLRAGSVLPPGQSGYVAPSGLAAQEGQSQGSPHLNDQISMFVDFRLKPATFRQPGTESRPPARPAVRIVRDAHGVPQVYGSTADDTWFGAGYAIAQDRLFQLELFQRATTGRLAEILGKGYVKDDIAVRRDFYTQAELRSQFARVPPELQARYRSYCDGVNAWVAETRSDPNKLPGEFAAVGTQPSTCTVENLLAIGVFLARTTPSGDGEEINNARGLRKMGPGPFKSLIPMRLKGQVATVPRKSGYFPSQPGRTRKQVRRAFARSTGFVRALPPLPGEQAASGGAAQAASRSAASDLLGRLGSNAWAIRGKGGRATLFSGPQQEHTIPNTLVELEVHGPGVHARGVTAAGVPVVAIGHNGRVAWGVTSSLSDDNDLYAERMTGEETYSFKGQTRRFECRNEQISWRSPPSDALAVLDLEVPDLSSGTQTERLCRTVHGPVQEKPAGGIAYARRYATWDREYETLFGYVALEQAKSVKDVGRAVGRMSWSENFVAADDRGHIGYWHPGLMPLRPRGYDERLPYPGTGEAEWRGFLPQRKLPHVIDPKQGWLSNWNNMPSKGWTSGDAPARERLSGEWHRGAFLERLVSGARRRGGGFEATQDVDRGAGTIAEQRPLATRKLRLAQRGASGDARVVLDTILAWDGSYSRTDANGTVDPGVAAWEEMKAAAKKIRLGKYGKNLDLLQHGRGQLHSFDIFHTDAFALRNLPADGWRQAAGQAMTNLEKRFKSRDAARWREPRRKYKTGSLGGAGSSYPDIPLFDRGTWQQIVEFGPGG